MNKLYIFGMMALAATAFTACSADEDPKYTDPTEFVLNTPPFADHTYVLKAGDVKEFTCSQPNYGLTLAPTYTLEFSLTPEFTTDEEGKPEYQSFTTGSKAAMEIKDADLSTIICKLLGITDYNSFPADGVPATPLYIRAVATLPTVAPCYSNVITLQGVIPYNPYREGGRVIYMVGNPTEWSINPASPYTLTETAPESNVYVGTFTVGAGEQYFRFYTEMNPDAANGGWGEDGKLPSIGADPNDNESVGIDIPEDGQPLVVKGVPGKGNWKTNGSWTGGDVTFTVDLRGLDEDDPDNSRIVVTMAKGEIDYETLPALYVAGQFSAWKIADPDAGDAYANFRVFDYGNNGLYSGTFYVPDGECFFRFFSQLGDWGVGSMGADPGAADGNEDVAFTGATYAGPYYDGSGNNWRFNGWTAGYIKLQVNTASQQVTFTKVNLTPSGEVAE